MRSHDETKSGRLAKLFILNQSGTEIPTNALLRDDATPLSCTPPDLEFPDSEDFASLGASAFYPIQFVHGGVRSGQGKPKHRASSPDSVESKMRRLPQMECR